MTLEQQPTQAAKAEIHQRMTEVVSAMMMVGLDRPLARMQISDCATWRCRRHCTWRRWTGRAVADHDWPDALREALIKLGPAFVKVGQLLSVRTDLVPPSVAAALHSLQSEVPPVGFDEIKMAIETELGAPIDSWFQDLNVEPIAAGSVAQVHFAHLLDGTAVALKVKRPGIDEVMALDLDVMVWLAGLVETRSKAMRSYRPLTAAKELRRYTLRELDFRREADTATRIRAHHGTDSRVLIPEIHFASRSLIVMDYIDGFPADDRDAYPKHGLDPHDLLHVGIAAVITQIFDLGVFHADPHPGNLHVTPNGDLVMLDFGIFGELDERTRRRCGLAMWALVRGDVELASMQLTRMARIRPDGDVAAFRAAVEDKYRLWRESKVSDYGLGRLVFDAMSLAGRHGLELPSDAILVGKALTTIEGLVLWVDPELDLNTEMQPYLSKVARRLFDPKVLGAEMLRSLPLWWDVLEQLPLGLAELTARQLAQPVEAPSSNADLRQWLGIATGLIGLALLTFGAAQLSPDLAMAVGLALVLMMVLLRRKLF